MIVPRYFNENSKQHCYVEKRRPVILITLLEQQEPVDFLTQKDFPCIDNANASNKDHHRRSRSIAHARFVNALACYTRIKKIIFLFLI